MNAREEGGWSAYQRHNKRQRVGDTRVRKHCRNRQQLEWIMAWDDIGLVREDRRELNWAPCVTALPGKSRAGVLLPSVRTVLATKKCCTCQTVPQQVVRELGSCAGGNSGLRGGRTVGDRVQAGRYFWKERWMVAGREGGLGGESGRQSVTQHDRHRMACREAAERKGTGGTNLVGLGDRIPAATRRSVQIALVRQP